MRPVACLHTIASNVAIFEAACPPGLGLRHTVRPDLLAEAERDGGMTPALVQRTAGLLQHLADGAAAVLLTCSTLGDAAAAAQATGIPVRRADAALADRVRGLSRATVLYTAPTSEAPTRHLFAPAALRLVAGAWPLFQAGALAAYYRCIADAADAAFADGAETVVLAQVSMAPAAPLCRAGVPLSVPAAALRACL